MVKFDQSAFLVGSLFHFPFALGPASRLFRTVFRVRTDDTVRLSFSAIAGVFMPASSISRSWSSSPRVQGRRAWRDVVIFPSPSAPGVKMSYEPPNIPLDVPASFL